MAGEQRYQIPVLLDQDGVYIVGVDDLYIHNFVSQGLPKICYVNLIPVLQQLYIQKVFVSVITLLQFSPPIGMLVCARTLAPFDMFS